MSLPYRRITLYKHGVGHYQRRGPVSGDSLRLHFPREAMDDVLKSLVAVDLGPGTVHSIGFETPEDSATVLARGSIHLSETSALLDLLRDLRGRRVRLLGTDEVAVEGVLVGVDIRPDQPARRGLVSLYLPDSPRVLSMEVASLSGVELLDPESQSDLSHALLAAQGEEERRTATLALSPGDHDLLVSYLAPAPSWRVSYRLLAEPDPDQGPGPTCLLQGWGIVDNQLGEDLQDVALTLVAGMPISFRYQLHEPHTPVRPMVADEERTVDAPVFFDAPAGAPPPMPAAAAMRKDRAVPMSAGFGSVVGMGLDQVEASVAPAASGEERGALFAYTVREPVSVGRGQSAMVPVLSARVPAQRELLYNGAKVPAHPVASLRLTNSSELTLERGPATVLVDGEYAGEAVLPFTTAGSEVLIPYAVELGITVTESSASSRTLHALRIHDVVAVIEEYDQRRVTYGLASDLADPVEVVLERERRTGFDLVDTPEPITTTATHRRWAVACPARGRVELVVGEQRLISRTTEVRTLTGSDLARMLDCGAVAEDVAAHLGEILAIYRKVDQAQAQLRGLAERGEALAARQVQIRGNLAPLGHERGEAALRARYVTLLNEIQDELDAADTDTQELTRTIAALEAEAATRLAALGQGSEGASRSG